MRKGRFTSSLVARRPHRPTMSPAIYEDAIGRLVGRHDRRSQRISRTAGSNDTTTRAELLKGGGSERFTKTARARSGSRPTPDSCGSTERPVHQIHHQPMGLSHDRITALFEDRHGALWIGTMHGVTRLKDGAFTVVSPSRMV